MMKSNYYLIPLVLFAALLLAGCGSIVRVGALQTESQFVELGNAQSVRVEIAMGAGNLNVAGGAEKLLEANFNYNVAKLEPEVEYANGTLIVRQPSYNSLTSLQGITDYRNDWDLRLYSEVPMDLGVDVGAGVSNLQLADLSLTGLDVTMGAGRYTIDLSGNWTRDLDVSIDAGAAELSLQLPKQVGVRVRVESGPHTIDAPGLTKNGEVYTNDAYGVSDVTLQINLEVGIGQIKLEVEK